MTAPSVYFELRFEPTPDSQLVSVIAEEILSVEMTTTGRIHVVYLTVEGVKKDTFVDSITRKEDSER